MAIDTSSPRSRRALLAGTVGGLAAVAAQAIGRPLQAQAAAQGVSYLNNEDNTFVIEGRSKSQAGFPLSGQGIAVYGSSTLNAGVRGVSSSGSGVSGTSYTGYGVVANSEQSNAIYAVTNSDADAIVAASTSGAAISAASQNGRGGTFSGKKAQLRLVPSTATSHPIGGARGDLFVDSSGTLWFCKGGRTVQWVRLA